jgi:hypothetical protein
MAFKRNNQLVWDETVKTMADLFENVWGGNPEVAVDNGIELTSLVDDVFESKQLGHANMRYCRSLSSSSV